MKRYDLPFEVLGSGELDEVKGDLTQLLYSLSLKEIAADLNRPTASDLFYKVMPSHSASLGEIGTAVLLFKIERRRR